MLFFFNRPNDFHDFQEYFVLEVMHWGRLWCYSDEDCSTEFYSRLVFCATKVRIYLSLHFKYIFCLYMNSYSPFYTTFISMFFASLYDSCKLTCTEYSYNLTSSLLMLNFQDRSIPVLHIIVDHLIFVYFFASWSSFKYIRHGYKNKFRAYLFTHPLLLIWFHCMGQFISISNWGFCCCPLIMSIFQSWFCKCLYQMKNYL